MSAEETKPEAEPVVYDTLGHTTRANAPEPRTLAEAVAAGREPERDLVAEGNALLENVTEALRKDMEADVCPECGMTGLVMLRDKLDAEHPHLPLVPERP